VCLPCSGRAFSGICRPLWHFWWRTQPGAFCGQLWIFRMQKASNYAGFSALLDPRRSRIGGGGGIDSGRPWPSPMGRISGVQIRSRRICEPATRPHYPRRPKHKKGHPSGGPFRVWWRRRVSNPRPQALRFGVYMLIPSLISLRATRRAGKTCNQFSKNLTVQILNISLPRSCVGDPWDPAAQARAGQRALGWFLSS